MKNTVERLVKALAVSSVAVTATVAFGSGPALAQGVREGFINDKSIELVYSIDDSYSYIVGGNLSEKSPSYTVVGRDKDHGALFIKHAPEAFAYKSPVLPSIRTIAAPKDGEMSYNSTNAGGVYREYTNLDLYEHMYAVCSNTGGTPSVIIPKRIGAYKRLTEVSAIEAFRHIVNDGQSGGWLFNCDGDKRFLLSKDYRFAANAPDTATFRMNRGLEGVSYLREGDIQYTNLASVTSESSLQRSELIKQTALEAASIKKSFVKGHNGSRYEALYNQTSKGCDLVSVKLRKSDNSTAISVYNYKVCDGSLVSLGETTEEMVLAKTNVHHNTYSAEGIVADAK